jgi:hypothetical protein
MAVILADKQFISYYNLNLKQIGVVASVPWASIGMILIIESFKTSLTSCCRLRIYFHWWSARKLCWTSLGNEN